MYATALAVQTPDGVGINAYLYDHQGPTDVVPSDGVLVRRAESVITNPGDPLVAFLDLVAPAFWTSQQLALLLATLILDTPQLPPWFRRQPGEAYIHFEGVRPSVPGQDEASRAYLEAEIQHERLQHLFDHIIRIW